MVSTSLAYFMLCDNPISGCFMPWCLHHWLIICWLSSLAYFMLVMVSTSLAYFMLCDNPISGYFMPWCLHHWLILCCVITPSLAALCHGVFITGLFYAGYHHWLILCWLSSLAYFMLCDNPISGCFMLVLILCCVISPSGAMHGVTHWLILCCVITPSLAALCHGVYITGLFYAV